MILYKLVLIIFTWKISCTGLGPNMCFSYFVSISQIDVTKQCVFFANFNVVPVH